MEDVITDICRATPYSKRDRAAHEKFQELSRTLENRFIAHVEAEMMSAQPNTRSREEVRKRPRTRHSHHFGEEVELLSPGPLSRPTRASAQRSWQHVSSRRSRRASARPVPKELFDDSDVEGGSSKSAYGSRANILVISDDEVQDDIIGDSLRVQPQRVRAKNISSAETSDPGGKYSSDDLPDSDDDYEDEEYSLSIPVVRPKRIVRKRSLCSDHMSLTPVINDDDEGTDSEERRKAKARRPLRSFFQTEEEPDLVFAVVPKEGHRLCFDQRILLPGADGSVFLPVPKPDGVSKPSEHSDILMHPLPRETLLQSASTVHSVYDIGSTSTAPSRGRNKSTRQETTSYAPVPEAPWTARAPYAEGRYPRLKPREIASAPTVGGKSVFPSSSNPNELTRDSMKGYGALGSIPRVDQRFKQHTPMPVGNLGRSVSQRNMGESSTIQRQGTSMLPTQEIVNAPCGSGGITDFNQFRSLMLAMGKSGMMPSMFYGQTYPQLMPSQTGISTGSHVLQPPQPALPPPGHILPRPPHGLQEPSQVLPPHLYSSSTLSTSVGGRVVGVPMVADMQPSNDTRVRQIPAEHVQDFKDVYKRTLLELKKHDTNNGRFNSSDLG